MTRDQILNIARTAILGSVPSVLIPCVVKATKSTFDTTTQANRVVVSFFTNLECVQESVTEDEIHASKILATDLKFHILNTANIDIDYYNTIEINGKDYKIVKSLKYFFGKDVAIYTIFAR